MCGKFVYVKFLYVKFVCVCVKLLYVTFGYVKLLYVKLLYVKFVYVGLWGNLCVGGGGRREEEEKEKEPGIQNQKQDPHTKMWGKKTACCYFANFAQTPAERVSGVAGTSA